MRKKSKNGINSGNTFRTTNTRYHRQYKRNSYLHRQSSGESYTVLHQFNIDDDNVIYSLNKKGRWNLLEPIREAMMMGEIEEIGPSIRLLISYDLQRCGQTVELLSETSPVRTRGTLMNGQSLLHEYAHFQDDPYTHLEFILPCPDLSSLYHCHKFSGFASKIGGCGLKSNRREEFGIKSKKRDKINLIEYCRFLKGTNEVKTLRKNNECKHDSKINIVKKNIFQFQKNNNQQIFSKSGRRNVCTESHEWESILTKHFRDTIANLETLKRVTKQGERKRQRLLKKNIKVNPKSESKTETCNYIPVRIDGTVRNTKLNSVRNQTSIKRYHVHIPSSAASPEVLKTFYGKRYMECPCFPRKFIIDVSYVLEKKWREQNDMSKFDIKGCIVFSYHAFRKQTTGESHDIYHVFLNIATRNVDTKFSTPHDVLRGDLEDVLQMVINEAETPSEAELIEKDKETHSTVTRTNFKTLNIYQKIHVESYSLSSYFCYFTLFEEARLAQKLSSCNDIPVRTSVPLFCGICHDNNAEIYKSVTALQTCQHFFCNDCWVKYLHMRLRTGNIRISCPSYNCPEVVPESVLLAFINVVHINKLLRRRIEFSILSQKNALLCPNPSCNGLILASNSLKSTSVSCRCGFDICLSCKKHAHWPASCEHAENYWTKLQKSGQDNEIFRYFQTSEIIEKECPNCGVSIERVDTGIFISCVCGAVFCWGCSLLYPKHSYSQKCFKIPKTSVGQMKRSSIKIYQKNNHTVSRYHSSYLKLAAKQRIARDLLTVTRLKKSVQSIIKQGKAMSKKKCELYLPVFEKFELVSDINFPSSRQKIISKLSGVLNECINVYISIHHIAEYSFVYLDELSQSGSQHSQLCSHIDQLTLFAEKITVMLKRSEDIKNFRSFLELLLTLEQEGQNVIKEFVSVINKIQKIY